MSFMVNFLFCAWSLATEYSSVFFGVVCRPLHYHNRTICLLLATQARDYQQMSYWASTAHLGLPAVPIRCSHLYVPAVLSVYEW